MEEGQVWYKKRQRPERSRFFSIKKIVFKENGNFGWSAKTITSNSSHEYCFIGKDDIEGFENKNELLTTDRIAKFILSGDLNTIIL